MSALDQFLTQFKQTADVIIDSWFVCDNERNIVDFNRAYAPPCAFTPYATCPLPPPQNRMRIAVEAGDKSGADHAGPDGAKPPAPP